MQKHALSAPCPPDKRDVLTDRESGNLSRNHASRHLLDLSFLLHHVLSFPRGHLAVLRLAIGVLEIKAMVILKFEHGYPWLSRLMIRLTYSVRALESRRRIDHP